MLVTLEGITMLVSEVQPRNAIYSMLVNWLFSPKVTLVSEVQ